MASEDEFANIQNANLQDSVTRTRDWADRKFPSLMRSEKPTTDELFQLWTYYQQHPGAPDSAAAGVLAKARGLAASGSVQAKHAKTVAADKAQSAAQTAGVRQAKVAALLAGNPTQAAALDKLPPEAFTANGGLNSDYILAHMNDPAVKALVGGGTAASAVLDQFAVDTPVFVRAQSGHPTSGGQSSTYGDVMTDFYKMGADTLRALKQRLWDGGFYPAGTSKDILNSSVPDVATKTAYEIAVKQAARLAEAGQPWTVDAVIASGNPDPAASTGAAAIGPYSITDPLDLKTAMNAAAQERLGMNLSDDEIKTYSALYQGMQAQSARRLQAAGRDNQQIGVVSAPDPSSAAHDYLDQRFANQEQAYGAVQRQQEFFHMLGAIV